MDSTALSLCKDNDLPIYVFNMSDEQQHRPHRLRRASRDGGGDVIDDLLKDARDRMGKSIEATRHEFATVRTGRASPHLLDRVDVDYYGTQTPLNQLVAASPRPRPAC